MMTHLHITLFIKGGKSTYLHLVLPVKLLPGYLIKLLLD
jgi:hypothetical protein